MSIIKAKYLEQVIARVNAVASMSESNRLKVGVIFLRDNRCILDGFNGLAPGTEGTMEGPDGLTLPDVVHAERNAIQYAARKGISLEGTTAVISHAPCLECAKALHGVGVNWVVYLDHYKTEDGINYLYRNGRRCISIDQVRLMNKATNDYPK